MSKNLQTTVEDASTQQSRRVLVGVVQHGLTVEIAGTGKIVVVDFADNKARVFVTNDDGEVVDDPLEVIELAPPEAGVAIPEEPEPLFEYVLVDDKGEDCNWCHQDDMENPVVADDIVSLVSQAMDWANVCGGVAIAIAEGKPLPGSDNLVQIQKRKVVVVPLDEEDKKELAELVQAEVADGDRETYFSDDEE